MPYTSHGHWYGPGEPTQPGPSMLAKCFGLGGCYDCRTQAGLPPLPEPKTAPETITVYASIGNSDDKLTQERWARFVDIFNEIIERYAEQIHGAWFSEPSSRWQNSCVAFTISPGDIAEAKEDLADIARRYGQDSIAWAQVPETEFIRPAEAVSHG